MTSKSVYWRWLLCSKARERYGQPIWDSHVPRRSFVHALYGNLGYHYVGFFRILFSLVFHCWGISPNCAAHQTRYSVLVSLR